MKTKLTSLAYLFAVLLIAGTFQTRAGEPPVTRPQSAEFERMKSLVGAWQGKVDMGQGPVDMTVQYRLIAGGTVLEERILSKVGTVSPSGPPFDERGP